jgi:hypothetical protein
LFGKGEWKNISNIQNIQAKYTFGKNGTVIMVSEDDNNTTDRGNKNKETLPNKKTTYDNAT